MAEIAHDVFISHAFEDKNAFTNDLAFALKQKGLKVWYSGFDLKMGDSITDVVNKALKSSKYAVVVISPIYLEKSWAMKELQALFAQEEDQKRILPILHNITVNEIRKHLPLMADRYAISSEKSLEFIVAKILEVVKGEKKDSSTSNGYSDPIKKKTAVEILSIPLKPVLLPLEAHRIMLGKIFRGLKGNSQNEGDRPKH